MVVYVILEVTSALCEDSNRIYGALWKVDLCFESASTRGQDKIRDVLCDRVVEFGVPFWAKSILFCVTAQLIEGAAFVEVKVLRTKGTIPAVCNIRSLVAMVCLKSVLV